MHAPKPDVTAAGLRTYGHEISDVWTDFVDDDVYELAIAAAAALAALARKVEVFQ